MTKTNKSYAKRLRVTKNGKVLRRVAGQCHFNAKKSRNKQMSQKGLVEFNIDKKSLQKAMPHK